MQYIIQSTLNNAHLTCRVHVQQTSFISETTHSNTIYCTVIS